MLQALRWYDLKEDLRYRLRLLRRDLHIGEQWSHIGLRYGQPVPWKCRRFHADLGKLLTMVEMDSDGHTRRLSQASQIRAKKRQVRVRGIADGED